MISVSLRGFTLMYTQRFLASLILVSLLVGVAPVAQATDYTYTTIDVPGATDTVAEGINGAGQIVGLFVDATGTYHGFLATPVPEPSTWLLFGTGLAGLAAWRRKQAA